MIGSILGDIAGSVYEFHNIKTKEFPFLTPQKGYTDDSILTLATADWLLHGGDCATYYFRYATRYPCPLGGFGGRFREWLHQGQQTGQLRPYGSCGNGSAMRVGPVGWTFRTEEETLELHAYRLPARTIIPKESRVPRLRHSASFWAGTGRARRT